MITIIGGGLAGLSLGIYLQKLNIQTRVIEAGTYPKHKVCGEFICGVDEGMLEEMGLRNIIDDSLHHNTMKWWMAEDLVLDTDMPQVAWGLSRYGLDQKLAEKFKLLGGELNLKQRAPQSEYLGEGVVISLGKSKKNHLGGNHKVQDTWIGLKIHVSDIDADWISGLEMHVGDAGYIGLCEVEGKRVNCCGLFKVNRKVRGRGSVLLINYLKSIGLKALASRLEQAQIDEASFSATAGFQFGKQANSSSQSQHSVNGTENLTDPLSLGDSAYLIPPFTGNGMSMAIESAFLAGKRIAEYSQGQLSWNECVSQYKTDYDAQFAKRSKLAALIHPMLFSNFGRLCLKHSARSGILPTQFIFNRLRTP